MDLESALQPVLSARFPGTRVVSTTPANLADVLPCLKLLTTGGIGNRWRVESTGFEVDAFAADRETASALAWDAYHFLMEDIDAIGQVGYLSATPTQTPINTPYDNQNIHRYTFNVTVTTHDRALT